MGKDTEARPIRPSRWWLVISLVCWVLAAVGLVGGLLVQRRATEPIGEGEVFVADADIAVALLDASEDINEGVRRIRNHLDLEAVSVIDKTGLVVASTSGSLKDAVVQNPLLAFGAFEGRFVALAAEIETPIHIDGVEEWVAEAVLYQVVAPISGTSDSVLLHYDLAELLARRVRPGEIQPETIQLLTVGVLFGLLGVAVAIGHSRVSRRYRDMERESELLRKHSDELQAANTDLDMARRAAERALGLAEEKMRIRSEFVLMINHELRTPLTAVVTGAELLRTEELSDSDRVRVLEAMVADGVRLQGIIDQILAVARIENRGLAYELAELPLDEVCATIKASHPRALPAGNSPHPGTRVRTDLKTLSLVVSSLVDNALTHGATKVAVSCSSGDLGRLMLEVGERPDQATFFTVADNGPGIDPEFLPRIFEKFEKNSFSAGTGLGLYMVRLMVGALEGSIGVATSPKGSVFQLAVPAVAAVRLVEPV